MRQAIVFLMAVSLATAVTGARGWAADGPNSLGAGVSCTGDGCACEPRCRAMWGEAKTKKTVLSMGCEYACARARDPWHAPEPDCRCHPPRGAMYVKKRLYKTEGEETVERVPKYEVEMVAAEPCTCGACRGVGCTWWNPFHLLAFFQTR